MCVTVKWKRGYSLYIFNPEGIQVTLVQKLNERWAYSRSHSTVETVVLFFLAIA